ncbi:hypothetical protein [Streptomyces cadmiisoli]|uniref:hypothetical protein n=1 Tax=Streptomyces cadmiisoli TaxID=2184053 RepID=UPI0013A6ECBE|nr:hypothetical protein [Streptomyces cadmiisoli]
MVRAGRAKENIALAEPHPRTARCAFALDIDGLVPQARKFGSIALFGAADRWIEGPV